jgi:magnesium and cobalt transporter
MKKNQKHSKFPAWIASINKLFRTAPKDRQALLELLRQCETTNLLDPDVLIMLEGALHVADMRVNDIMVPKVQMDVVAHDSDPGELIKTVVASGHSRFPVIGEDSNNVMGILLAKDLLAYFAQTHTGSFDIKDVMRPAIFIPESKRLNVLLREFRSSRNHMAIVVDEYGVTGLVTIEDIIEEIVGEIEDEHDFEEEDNIRLHGVNRYTVRAITPIEEFNARFGTALSDAEYDTIGGLVVNAFGHLPKRGESIDLAGFHLKVLRADRRRVQLLKFTKGEG